MSEQLRNDEDKSGLLERALRRLEWERSQEAAKQAAEDVQEKERNEMVGRYMFKPVMTPPGSSVLVFTNTHRAPRRFPL